MYRRGNKVSIAKTGNDLCPVFWLKKYVDLAYIDLKSEFYIFRPLSYLKSKKS